MGNRRIRLLKRFHPEGIPWPGSILYNALSGTGIFLRHYELVAHDVARLGSPRRLLDIGTGPGRLLTAIRETLPETELVGVDISAAMVGQAVRNTGASRKGSFIKMSIADVNALPFGDETFNCVISTGSLHHWKDPCGALTEAYRVLSVPGYALLYDLVRDLPRTVRADIRRQFGPSRLALLWLHSFEEPFLNSEEMVSLARQTDFLVEGVRFAGAFCCLVLKKPTAAGLAQDSADEDI